MPAEESAPRVQIARLDALHRVLVGELLAAYANGVVGYLADPDEDPDDEFSPERRLERDREHLHRPFARLSIHEEQLEDIQDLVEAGWPFPRKELSEAVEQIAGTCGMYFDARLTELNFGRLRRLADDTQPSVRELFGPARAREWGDVCANARSGLETCPPLDEGLEQLADWRERLLEIIAACEAGSTNDGDSRLRDDEIRKLVTTIELFRDEQGEMPPATRRLPKTRRTIHSVVKAYLADKHATSGELQKTSGVGRNSVEAVMHALKQLGYEVSIGRPSE